MMKELLAETHLEAYLDYFRIDKKKYQMQKLLFAIGLGFLGVLAFAIFKHPLFLALVVILGVVGFKLPYMNLISMMRYENLKREILFPQFLRTFMALLSSQGNPYQTLVKATEYMKDPIKSDLEELIKEIEVDNDLKHYVAFADKIGTSDAQMVMSMIYSFTKSGIIMEELEELERTIETMKVTRMKDMVARKSNKQETYANYIVILSIFYILCYVGCALVLSLGNLGM